MPEQEHSPEFHKADLIVDDNEMFDLVVEKEQVTLTLYPRDLKIGQRLSVGTARAEKVNSASHTAIVESIKPTKNSRGEEQIEVVLKLEKKKI